MSAFIYYHYRFRDSHCLAPKVLITSFVYVRVSLPMRTDFNMSIRRIQAKRYGNYYHEQVAY